MRVSGNFILKLAFLVLCVVTAYLLESVLFITSEECQANPNWNPFNLYRWATNRHSRPSCLKIGSNLLVVPPAAKTGLYLYEGPLQKVQNATRNDITLVSKAFSVMESYQTITRINCMAMHHFAGYNTSAKRIVGIYSHEGGRYIRGVNPVINGWSGTKVEAEYHSTRCPQQRIHLSNLSFSISLSYIQYNDHLMNEVDWKSVVYDWFGAIPEDRETKESTQQNLGHIVIEKEWFSGEEAVCLQAIMMEFDNIDLCNK